MALDPYQTLGVDQDATGDEIRAAYRRKAAQTHPDRHPDDPFATTRFQQVRESYDILSDADRRARYDRGENPERRMVETGARDAIIGALLDVLRDGRMLDGIVRHVRADLGRSLRVTRKNIELLREQVQFLELAKDRFRFGGQGEDVLALALDGQVGQTQERLALEERKVEAFERAMELIGEYDDVEMLRISAGAGFESGATDGTGGGWTVS